MAETGPRELDITLLAAERSSLTAASKRALGYVATVGLVVVVRVEGHEPDIFFSDDPHTIRTASTEATRWPADQARRLYSGLGKLYDPNRSGDPSCYDLVDEVMDWPVGTAADADTKPVNPARLRPGVPYGIRRGPVLQHVMFGLSQPDRTLAIGGKRDKRGQGGDLIVHHTDYALDAYDGDVIVQLLPPGA
jgi:hypothetical protein